MDKKKYRVVASYKVKLIAEIEADSKEEAQAYFSERDNFLERKLNYLDEYLDSYFYDIEEIELID
jgi:hypothetical protein